MRGMVMVPTYNERENIEPLVAELLSYPDLSILIVDDQSPDGTGDIADQLAALNPERIFVLHRTERGRGTAGIAGLKQACDQDIDYIIEMDADFSHNPSDIKRMVTALERHNLDVVIGSRAIDGGVDDDRSLLRMSLTIFASIYTQFTLGRAIKDWSGGFKCYRRDMLAKLDWNQFYSKGYSIGAETLYRLQQLGASMKEIPIQFQDRRAGYSKFNVNLILEYFWVALKLKLFVRKKSLQQ